MDRYGPWLVGAADGSGLLGSIAARAAALVEVVGVDDPGADASQRLSWAIIGLLVLAGVICIATMVFWRLTKPERESTTTGSMRTIAPVVPTETTSSAALTPSVPSPPRAPAPVRPASGPQAGRPANAPAARPAARTANATAPAARPPAPPASATGTPTAPTAPAAPVRRPARNAGADPVAG